MTEPTNASAPSAEAAPKGRLGAIVISFILCVTYVDLLTSSFGCSSSSDGGGGSADAASSDALGDVSTPNDTGGSTDGPAVGDGPAGDAPSDAHMIDASTPDAPSLPDASSSPDAPASQPDASPDAA